MKAYYYTLFLLFFICFAGCSDTGKKELLSAHISDLVITPADSERYEIGFSSDINSGLELSKWISGKIDSNFSVVLDEEKMSEQSKMIRNASKGLGSKYYCFEVVDNKEDTVVLYFSSFLIGEEDSSEWLCSISIFDNPSKGFNTSLIKLLEDSKLQK